jgi:N-acetylglucosamine kinase-like BadF-type ATPase
MGKTLAEIASAVRAVAEPAQVVAGMTGFDEGDKESIAMLIAAPLGVAHAAVSVSGDMEIAYLDVFAPGEGYLVYAGTGSVAAFIDASGECHRVGGHGGILDDAGSGFWIAACALRHIWRSEDERPGSSRRSPMAREVFARIGSSEWAGSRQFVYGGSFETRRGDIGRLALAVAAAADASPDPDPDARRILTDAGAELGRLARIMSSRFGPRPVALAGRVAQLHPLIEQGMRASMSGTAELQVRVSDAHHAAARIAARRAAKPPR